MFDTIEETYRKRLNMLIEEYGGQVKLSDVIKKSPVQISQWVTGAPDSKTGKPRSLKSDTAREIEKLTNKPRAWFDQPVYVNAINNQINMQNHNTGNGIQNNTQNNFLPSETHSGSLKKIVMPDNAMLPTFPQGSELTIDTSQTAIIDGKIYEIQSGGLSFIRRIYRQIDGSLKIVCDNPEFESVIVSSDSVQIVGRVIEWRVRD